MAENGGNDKVRQKSEVDRRSAAKHDELDELLDEALQETFPASDPVSLTSKLKPGAPQHGDRKQTQKN